MNKPNQQQDQPPPEASSFTPGAPVTRGFFNKISQTIKKVAGSVLHRDKSRNRWVDLTKALNQAEQAHIVSNSDQKKPDTPPSSETRTGALAPDTTSEDVLKSLSNLQSSPTAQPEATATDLKEHFFHDQNAQHTPPPAAAPREVPDEYGDTRLVLLVRDPEWVYAYWEINDATRELLNLPRNGSYRGRMVLRFFKTTDRNWPEEAAHYFFDVDVNYDARSWYVHLPEASEDWCAELGSIDRENQYTPICRSNDFTTPRMTLSHEIDSEWMTVEESFEKITRLGSSALKQHLQGSDPATSSTLLRHLNRQVTRTLHGERASMTSTLFSSESLLRADSDKAFRLEVRTEVILHGATEPDAHVTVQGMPVTLNSDGTFTLRFPFPEGKQVLEVRAHSADGDLSRTITPVVERTTR